MRKIVVSLMVLLLSGCMSLAKPPVDINETIVKVEKTLNSPYDFRANNTTTYFSYYLPSDTQEFESSENATIIEYMNSRIVMNLNIPSIINNVFYIDSVFDDDGFFVKENLIHESNGTFIKSDGNESNYFIKVYQDGETYLVQVKTNELNFYAKTSLNEVEEVIKHIFLIAQSVEVDSSKVISTYSAKEIIDYQKKQVDLFDYVVPSEGYLNDLVSSSNGTIVNPGNQVSNNTSEGISEEIEEAEYDDEEGENKDESNEESEDQPIEE